LIPPVKPIQEKGATTRGRSLFQICAKIKGGYREKLPGKAQVKSDGQTPENVDKQGV